MASAAGSGWQPPPWSKAPARAGVLYLDRVDDDTGCAPCFVFVLSFSDSRVSQDEMLWGYVMERTTMLCTRGLLVDAQIGMHG